MSGRAGLIYLPVTFNSSWTRCQKKKKRAEKFTFADKYREYVVTRGLLRQALAQVLNRDATSFHFNYTESNKPWLDEKINGQSIAMNVTHSHGIALVALSLDRQLGIDIEKIREEIEYEKLSKRFFSEHEYDALKNYQGDKVQAFFAIWTRKEAFVKAVGKGIAFGLSQFDVNIDPQAEPEMLATRWDENDVSNWFMSGVDVPDGYLATVVADKNKFDIRYH